MQKTSRKRRPERSGADLAKAAHLHAVHADSNLHLAPTLHLDPGATLSNSSRGIHFTFGPVAGAAAVAALRLAHFETQAKIALLQLATLATITVGNQHHSSCSSSRLAAVLPHHPTLLSLLNRQRVSTVGLNVNTNSKTYTTRQPYLSSAMYHHHSQQQGPQPFSSGARPAHHQPPPNHQQNRPASDILSQTMGFQFPRPTQLPDELESALAIRGARDMDHRSIEHMSLPSAHQNQGPVSGIGQHGGYNSNPMTLTSDSQPGHQQGVDWSSYQPPTKLFATPTHSAGHQSSHNQGPHQQAQSTHGGTGIQNWGAPAKDLPSPQARHPHSGSGDGQGMYTPESAGSILASFGLSNEDLEVLSHYPDDQLTPDTLPFILRDIQINKSGSKKTVVSNSASSFSRNIHDMLMTPSRSSPLTRSHSPEVPSLLTVTQTAGKVIDYGHASRTKEDNNARETFKREPLSSERTVKMYASSSSVSSPKVDKTERQVRMEHLDSSKHGDRDYRRTSSDHRKNSLSNEREIPLSTKSRNLDRDYRNDGLKLRPSSETRTKTSSRRSLSSTSGTKPHSTSKMLPTPTMISDFSAVSPKVYPHTCSLCHTQCDQEKDWVDHINTVNHTAACRDLRNKYPEWKPNPASPPPSKYRVDPHGYKPHGRPYSLPHHTRHLHYTGGSSHSGLKRPHEELSKRPTATSAPRASQSYKHGPPQSGTKMAKSYTKPETKTAKTASSKNDTSAKPPPAKKKKKIVSPPSQDSSIAGRLVYLTGIPKNASEQDVTDLVGSFGKINNVILMPCSEEESHKGEGQKASVCMVKAEDAQALANSTNLTIQDQQITTSIAKKCEVEPSAVANSRKTGTGTLELDKRGSRQGSGGDAGMKTSDEKAIVLIAGLPEGGWSESDIVKLVQPFGAPSDIIIAASIRKVLVCVPDVETAQEIVKVHTFIPAKIKDAKLKMTHVKQNIGMKTPVALYNLLMGTLDPLETPAPVGWSSLLVISNVPDTPSASSEVEKLVRRFGTVIKTLVLNNMVICEMATAAMSLSVYKRFQKFPCILQSNPLFFSRKPDPKANIQAKVIAAYVDPSEEAPANGKESNTPGAEDEEEKGPKESSETPLEKMDQEQGEEVKGSEQEVGGDEVFGENQSKDDKSTQKESVSTVSECPATSGADGNETSAVEASSDMQTTKSEAANDTSPAREDTSTEEAPPELPKVTQEMVNALLVECRTRTSSNPSKSEASDDGEQAETQTQAAAEAESAAEETQEPGAAQTEEEVKKQEKERKDREAKKERERKEKERRAWEKEKREREERERRLKERDRREWEKERIRRERERRERKRPYAEGARPLTSYRSEGHRASSWREQQSSSCEAQTNKQEEEAQEECDEFPFNLSDFITVDEVGDVTDLPESPSSVPMETTEGGEDAPQDTQAEDTLKDTLKDTMEDTLTVNDTTEEILGESMEDTVKDTTEDTTETPSDAACVTADVTVATSPSAAPQAPSPSSQTPTPAEQPGAPAAEVPTPAPPTSAGPRTASSDSSSHPRTTEPESAEASEERVPHERRTEGAEKMVVVSDTSKDEGGGPSAEDQTAAEELKGSEKNTNTDGETTKIKLVSETLMSRDSLPPFDPNNPVGLEFLVPKTGFFCKVCNRFFSGNKEAEVGHCRSFKHYDNLQKYLETNKAVNGSTKPRTS